MKYKLLGKSGLKVSEICLGTMTFGEDWEIGTSKENSKKIFTSFIDAGGNFIDTANRYTEGSSESFLGEFIAPMRDKIVLATKYSLYNEKGEVNSTGNNRKNMIRSLEKSLTRLKTDYVDVLYLHAWDGLTPLEEIMRTFDDLITAGKVLYIGLSDTPAWIVSRADTMAELRGWHRVVATQAEYSLITRDAERDILPMADALDIAVTAWAPLAGGALTGKYLQGNSAAKRLKEGSKRLNENSVKIAKEVVSIAEESGCHPAAVAINWVMKRSQVVIPVIGARTADQMAVNLSYKDVTLSDKQIERLNTVSAIELGFPHDFLNGPVAKELLFGGTEDKIHNHRKR